MVKKLLKFFAYFLFFIFALIAFLPKTNLYYLAEKNIKPLGAVISDEQIDEHLFSLELKHSQLSFQGVDSAKIDELEIRLFAFYNTIEAKNILLSSMASSFVPLRIKEAKVSYSVIDPLHIKLYAKGEFGEIRGAINLKEKRLTSVLHPSKLMLSRYQNTLREFKKDKKGGYRYDQAF